MSNGEKSYKAREKMGKLSFGERERENVRTEVK